MIRSLTAGEIALAATVFGDALDVRAVRLLAAPWPFTRAFVPGRAFGRLWIVWPGRRLAPDMARAPLAAQSTFIHELVHVWQASQGINLLFAKLKAGDSRASYAYPLERCGFGELNIEQQAMAIEHAFRLSRGGRVPAAADFYETLLPFACPWRR